MKAFIPCDNKLSIANCLESNRYKSYECENAFDTKLKSSSWGFYYIPKWIQLNLRERYRIHSLMIFQSSVARYRAENVSLQISNDSISNFTLNDINGWNKIILPKNIHSNYVNLTVKSKYGSGNWVGVPQIQVVGCRIGNVFLLTYHRS